MPKKRYEQHTHRYVRVIMGKDYLVFKCNLPTCPHYLPAKLAEGKLSICNRCQNPFILDKRAMKLVEPHCTSCIESKIKEKEPEKFDAITDFLEEKGI